MLSSLLPSSLAFLAESDLTIGIKHTSAYGFRREQLDRLLRSIRRRYATAEVIVADDGCKADRTAARTHNVTLVCTEAGSGLSLGRNTIVRRASTEFVLLLDDDVVFSEATDLAALHDALVRDPGAALAGGCYDDLEGGDADCFNLAFSVTGGGTAVAARFATLQAQGGGCGVVDATHNFFLARRSALVQHGWDARQKLMEHQAFFYALWLHGLRVLACPAVRVQHPRKRGPRARHAGVRQTAQRLGDRGRTSLKSSTPELGLLHAGHAVPFDPGVTLRHGTTLRGSTSSSSARQRESDYLQYLCRNFPRIDSWATPWWTVDCGAHTFKSVNDESPMPLAWDASDDTSIVAHTLRDDLGLFVLVLSAQGRAAARDTLRQSWIRIFGRGSGAVHGMRWDYGFFLGGAGAASPAPLMRGDIVRLASPDGYAQLGEKVVAALAWSVAHVRPSHLARLCALSHLPHPAAPYHLASPRHRSRAASSSSATRTPSSTSLRSTSTLPGSARRRRRRSTRDRWWSRR